MMYDGMQGTAETPKAGMAINTMKTALTTESARAIKVAMEMKMAETEWTGKSAMGVSINSDCRKPLSVKQMEAMEDGWRMYGGMKPIRHVATGENGGFFPSCGEKIIQGFARTSFEYVLST